MPQKLAGEDLGLKDANYFGLKSTLTQIWGQNKDFTVVELNHNFFQFIFPNKEEETKVLQRRP